MEAELSAEERQHGAIERARAHFGGLQNVLCARSPGRVNLIGEHTDYNEGFVMPMGIDRFVWAFARPAPGGKCRAFAKSFGEAREWESAAAAPPESTGRWAAYVFGAKTELAIEGLEVPDFEIYIEGDVPDGAGLSSSAAASSAVGKALAALAGRPDFGGVELAALGRRIEHNHLGVRCGIMDQMACCLAGKGAALFLDCRDLTFESIPFRPGEAELLIFDTKVKRTLAGSAYNDRRRACEDGVAALSKILGRKLSSLRDVEPGEFQAAIGDLPPETAKRCGHVLSENGRVAQAAQCLRKGDFQGFGALLNESHESLRRDYEVSCAELDRAVETALEAGALGARMTGAGFGGCAIVLADRNISAEVADRLVQGHKKEFGKPPAVFPARSSDGVCLIDLQAKAGLNTLHP